MPSSHVASCITTPLKYTGAAGAGVGKAWRMTWTLGGGRCGVRGRETVRVCMGKEGV